MKLHTVQVFEIKIAPNRQRRTFKPEDVVELASSISQNGLIHPIVVRKGEDGAGYVLVAGERRLRAMHYMWEFGEKVRCGEYTFSEGEIPCLYVGELEALAAFEMELEENIRRVDLPWTERCQATADLYELRKAQAVRDGADEPTMQDIALETHGTSGDAEAITRQEVLVSRHLSDPEVAKAKTVGDAFKYLKRKESLQKSADLALSVGVNFSSSVHTLRQGDCFEVMAELPKETFDVVLTDPPYGINADTFGDSGGMAAGGGSHFYDDSWTNWNVLAKKLASEAYRLGKLQCHCYIFCDVDQFVMLKSFMTEAGWRVFRTPLIWVNPGAMRAPWPEHGPQRKYQLILFAIKGDRPVLRLYSDVLTYPSDANLNHPAQKPVAVYVDLLRRSANPGDTVLDCFGGTGTVIPACHEQKCRATYIEADQSAYGIAIQRLKDLE